MFAIGQHLLEVHWLQCQVPFITCSSFDKWSTPLKKSNASRKWHKVLSLLFTPLLIVFAITGIGLNHAKLIEPISISVNSLPENYHFKAWNRGSLQAFAKDQSGGVYAGGKNGIGYFFKDNFSKIDNPLAKHQWHNFIYSLYLDTTNSQLYVGSRNGLFRYNINKKQWHYYQQTQNQRIVSLLKNTDDNSVLAIANHQIYSIKLAAQDNIKALNIQLGASRQSVPLFRFIFALHSGEVWGILGILLMDLLAIALIYFSLSGLYYWLFPKFTKRQLLKKETKIKGGKIFNWLSKNHNKLGLFFAPLLLISALTAMVMRPPGLLFIVSSQSPVAVYPSHGNEKIPYKITKAAMHQQQLILLTDDGVFSGTPDDNELFDAIYFPVPVHGMGATVFEQQSNGNLLVGSFSGLYNWNFKTNEFNSVQLAKQSKGLMPVAVFQEQDSLVIFDFFKGKLFDEAEIFSQMPDNYNDNARMALWNFFFELHNLRIFQHYIGPLYLLLLLFCSLALCIITITGTKRYLAKRSLRNQRQQALSINNEVETR